MDSIVSIATVGGAVFRFGPTWNAKVVHEDETTFVVDYGDKQTTIYRRHVVAVVRKVER